MIFRISIFNWRFTFTFAPVTNVIGVNSNLPNDKHILMWDFDDVLLEEVAEALINVQKRYRLPKIYILSTGGKDHYIAYCFARCTWRESIRIVTATECVDMSFIRFGVYRKHWTLRVSPKEGRKPKLKAVLTSKYKEDCRISDLDSWTKYETIADHAPIGKVELNVP
jgi:hypothetical protein